MRSVDCQGVSVLRLGISVLADLVRYMKRSMQCCKIDVQLFFNVNIEFAFYQCVTRALHSSVAIDIIVTMYSIKFISHMLNVH